MFKKKTVVSGHYIAGEISDNRFHVTKFITPAVLVPRSLNVKAIDELIKELTAVKVELTQTENKDLSCVITIESEEGKNEIDVLGFFPKKIKTMFKPS